MGSVPSYRAEQAQEQQRQAWRLWGHCRRQDPDGRLPAVQAVRQDEEYSRQRWAEAWSDQAELPADPVRFQQELAWVLPCSWRLGEKTRSTRAWRRSMIRFYRYIGSQTIAHAVARSPQGHPIRSVADLERWMHQTHQHPTRWGLIEATFVITEEGVLCLADRHSEHVACAGGRAVRSAGEMFFVFGPDGWEVQEVSNQSAGYCPEPTSWPEVAAALEAIPLPHPGAFTQECLFRRCPGCQQLNLIKEDVFACARCGSKLPRAWNCEAGGETGTTSESMAE